MSAFDKYFLKGFIKKQRSNFKLIEKQIIRAVNDLKTAKSVLEADPEWAATIAYQAMLRGGRSLIYSYGYLPADGAQHRTVVELTGILLGDKYKSLTLQFNKLRKKRNLFFYESDDSGNYEEAKGAIESAAELLNQIAQHINNINPQIELNIGPFPPLP